MTETLPFLALGALVAAVVLQLRGPARPQGENAIAASGSGRALVALLAGSTLVLAATGLGTLFRPDARITGYALLLHMAAGLVFVVTLAILAVRVARATVPHTPSTSTWARGKPPAGGFSDHETEKSETADSAPPNEPLPTSTWARGKPPAGGFSDHETEKSETAAPAPPNAPLPTSTWARGERWIGGEGPVPGDSGRADRALFVGVAASGLGSTLAVLAGMLPLLTPPEIHALVTVHGYGSLLAMVLVSVYTYRVFSRSVRLRARARPAHSEQQGERHGAA